MSDKSFGDHMSRGQVKNPLLSSSVTGVSIEDLTQNAVLLPVSRTQELFGRQDQIGPQTHILANENFSPNIPSGDFTPIQPPDYITQQNAKNTKTLENDTWPAQAKTQDDFDVNEYFARLQGSRYVSAPINSHLKEDANANLEDKEQNLEEINLNEPDKQIFPEEVQQSLTADIAQNFSQLPTVLPQVASAVFSSFSNMLSMKSREQTPEEKPQFERVDVGVPLVGVSEVKEVAPPAKEPPVCGPGNFRITTKKKAYAQIPGLSSRDSSQPANPPPAFIHQPIFTPSNTPNNDYNISNTPQTNLDLDVFNNSNTVRNIPVETSDRPNVFEAPKDDEAKSFATPQFNQEYNPQTPIIPPPPMFSNLAKRDSLSNTGKTVLPPSVARRISSNKPTISTQPATFTSFENIFVPAPINFDENASHAALSLPPTASQTFAQPTLVQSTETLPVLSISSSYASQGHSSQSFMPALTNKSMTMSSVDMPLSDGLTPPKNISFTTGLPLNLSGNLPPPPNTLVPTPIRPTDSFCSMIPTQSSSELASSPMFISGSKSLPPPPTFASESQPANQPAKNIFAPISANISSHSENASSGISMPPATSYTPQIFNPGAIEKATPGLQTELIGQNIASQSSNIEELKMVDPSDRVQYSMLNPLYTAPALDTKIPEPPKALGNTNFRMAKKRPQYYSGPIEGVGAMSNNQKPYLAPVASTSFQVPAAFQGAIFTPEMITSGDNTPLPNHQSAVFTPEVQSKTNFALPGFSGNIQEHIPFSKNAPETSAYNVDYNTAFDMSRPTTDNYEPSKQDSAFGIIGSLKSKLSAIDINKIQSSVTTFFDPKYNVAMPGTVKENETPIYGQSQSGIEIFVPNAETSQPYSYDYHQANFTYGHGPVPNPSEYYQQQVHNVYSPESYYSEPHYGTENFRPIFEGQQSHGQPFFAPPSNAMQNIIGEVPENQDNAETGLASIPQTQVSETSHKKDDNEASGLNQHIINPESISMVHSFEDLQSKLAHDQPKTHEYGEVGQLQHYIENMHIKDEKEPDVPQTTSAGSYDNSDILLSKQINKADLTSPLNEDCALNIEKSFGKTGNYFNMIENAGKVMEESINKETDSSNDAFSTPLYNFSLKTGAGLLDDGVSELDEQDEVSWNSNEEECDDQSIAANLMALTALDSPDDEFFVDDNGQSSDLNICETCREVTKPEEKEADLTSQLIENITSPIQLLNPVGVPLPENDEKVPIDFNPMNQCAEISLIADKTVETLQVQSASELLDDEDNTNIEKSFGWHSEASFPSVQALDHDFTFKPNANALGFFGNNNLFFDNIPNNASDEIKAEFIVSQDETPLVLRQMSVPTAPPAEDLDDAKFDETSVLDVQSIEQDASNDFPVFEEFVIEPSETDDDKLEIRDKSDEVKDTFTNRVDRFKKLESSDDLTEKKDDNVSNSNTIMPSYFDTGNYAVETHYKNSLTSPTSAIKSSESSAFRVPPGFENNFDCEPHQGLESWDLNKNKKDEPELPDTSTQTSITTTVTFSSVPGNNVTTTTLTKTTPVFQESKHETKLPDFASIFGAKVNLSNDMPSSFSSENKVYNEPSANPTEHESPINVENKIKVKTVTLPDPINFFASTTEEAKASDGINRLASYFASPVKTDDKKPFFELSQGQDHYRQKYQTAKESDEGANTSKNFFELGQSQDHYKDSSNISQDTYLANLNLMKDLTSLQNVEPSKEQVVRSINYFTIEYDDVTLNKGEPTSKEHDKTDLISNEKNDIEETILNTDETLTEIVNKCKFCCDFKTGPVVSLRETDFGNLGKVSFKQAMDGGSGNLSEGSRTQQEEKAERSVNLKMEDVVPDGDNNDGVAMMSENRSSSEYEPLIHHWFYRMDLEDKSTWRGFSANDSKALEDAFQSPDLTENTLVATDGGRFDVNVMGRLRIAVYWADKPTNVRRCSWFYKGTTDARYVPYTEPVAQKLEEEYRHGVTTGEWHRRLVLPNNEMVVMHGPAVMVHFLQASTADPFGAPNLFTFGKRVYRNPPKFKVPPDVPVSVDHLLLLVHGAGEWRNQKEKIQSTMRPRVVRRGFDESEIEDPEPSSIDHLLMLCHGVGSACDMRFRSVEEVVDDFRATSLQLLQSHYRNSFDSGLVGRVEVLPISWHASLHSGPCGVDRRLACVTLQSIPRLRNFTNDTVLDVLFYTSPHYCQMILNTVCGELNRVYSLFVERNPSFKGGVSLGGHSLGSVILYDLLCNQELPARVLGEPQQGHFKKPEKTYIFGTEAKNPVMVYPKLQFEPLSFYALGSPIAIFECIRGVEALGGDFCLPTCRNFFNIFHPYDPIAYRIEPLINQQLQNVKPSLIPHHKGRKRMHLELKDTMARVGADLKQRLVESIRSTWSSMWAPAPPPQHQLEKVVEEELEKEQLEEDPSKEEPPQTEVASGDMLGRLNGGRRVDYVLQEAPFEMINEYLFAMSSHVCYWESEDTMLLILREIYDSMGVEADISVPQTGLTVHRTRVDETSAVRRGGGYMGDQALQNEVKQLVDTYKPAKVHEAPVQLRITLKDDVPVAQRPRRLAFAEQQEVDRQVKQWLEEGIIRVSHSEYASPLVLVKKKDGSIRICIDYRQVNKKIVKDEYPLPIIDDHIDKLAKAKVFSTLDLKNGYFHLAVHEDSVKYTAFVTHNGQYEFLRAPFGLSVCPKVFMRFINAIFRDLIEKGFILIFIDDVIIIAEDERQAVERLKLVLLRASQYGLQVNWKKSQLVQRRVEYLGHVVENGTVRPSPEKTDAVLRFPRPTTLKQLHSFVGLASYFRKFIPCFALIARPLTDLLKKDMNFTFDSEQKEAFEGLKRRLANHPVLRIYDPCLKTELHTDASIVAYAAVLMQHCSEDGELHPVHYMSRKTSDAEKKYTSYELEALAIIEAVKKFRPYLFGIKFKIVTDCQAFELTLRKKDLSTRVARWVLLLQEYDYEVEHRKGSHMKHVDALSRSPFIGTITRALWNQIKRAQELDDGLKAILEVVKEKTYLDYSIQDGILYKGLQLVVPRGMEDYVIKKVHENGHFGKKKMIETIIKDYFIKDLSQKIDEFLVTCVPCLLATKKTGKQEGFLNTIEKGSVPLHTLHCDHIGPLSETKKMYNHILTVVDGFTKFVWLFPVKTTTAKETIEKLRIQQQTFGNPTRLITDRGAAYTSNDFKEYCAAENIQHSVITTGVPRGNGQVERIHRTMISVLTKLCIAEPAAWYKHVARVQTALNSTYQRSIDMTPFELMLGTKMRCKEDIEVYDLLLQEEREAHIAHREELRRTAKTQILKVQEENKQTYNKRRKKSTLYQIGDRVAIARTQFGTCLKLKPKYLGPYEVVAVRGKDRYDVEKLDGSTEGPLRTSTSADLMKPWPWGQ